MSSAIFDTIKALEARACISLASERVPTRRLSVTMIGARMDIDVFEDDHIEISCFHGNETVKGGKELLTHILTTQESEVPPR